MSNHAVGKEVLSKCTSCKLALAHTIMNMKDEETIGKCKCNTCKRVHNYKDPNAPVKKKATRKSPARKTKSADMWLKSVSTSNPASHIKYTIKTVFSVGDIIDHPNFGKGVVIKAFDGNKIEVIFKAEEKILMHNK